MDDYKYAFIQDIKEKKSIARSAFHKKGGAKSKKVTLPNERITRKEWEAMNGEVKTIQLGKPMTWAEFKSLDKDIQEKYLNCLVDGYGARAIDISNMFGISRGAFTGYTCRAKLKTNFSRGVKKLTDEQRKAWREFCDGVVEEPEPEDIPEESAKVEEPIVLAPVTFDVYTSMDIHQQKEYLKLIRDTFGVGVTLIAQMMGVDRETLYSHCVKENLDYILKGKIKPTKEQQSAWIEFCGPDEKAEEEQPEAVVEEAVVNDISCKPVAPAQFSLDFVGPLSVNDIADAIRRLVGADTLDGSIHISFIGGVKPI